MSAAAGGGHADVLQYLIGQKGNVDKSEYNQFPPLHAAAAKGSLPTMSMLINAKCDLDVLEDMLGQTALHAAIDRDQSGVIPLLLNAGAAIDLKTKLGVTPLAHACAKNSTDCVKLLLSSKADLRSESDKNISPMGAAANKGHIEIVK